MELTDDSAPAPVVPEPEKPSQEETPPAPKEEVTPADPTPPVVPESKEELFDLPDGRKVNAAGLKQEYENLLPEFTRKSQRLAELEGGKDIKKPDEDVPEWRKPDYEAKSVAEIIEIATAEAERKLNQKAEAETNRVKGIQTEVENQLGEVKKLDPKVDENALFQHANKYGFQNLKAAYVNMTDMRKVVLDTEKRVVKNVKEREADPVAGAQNGATSPDDSYDPNAMSQFANAQEYLARIKAGKK